MSRKVITQTNYQITQTGGKLDMSNLGMAATNAALGYPGAAARFQKAAGKCFSRDELKTLKCMK